MLLVVACLLVSAAARVAAGAVPAGGNAQTGSASQTNLEKASSYAQIVGVGGALIALGLIVWQVREARKEARHHRATAILARFNAPEFKDSWSRAFAFLDADSIRDRTEKIRTWEGAGWAGDRCLPRTPRNEQGKPSKNDINHGVGFFEEVAVLFNRETISRDLIVKTFGLPVVDSFNTSWWFICWRRAGEELHETQLYGEWEKMVGVIVSREPELAESDEMRRTLLLAPPTTANDEVWDRYLRLASAFDKRVEAGEDLANLIRQAANYTEPPEVPDSVAPHSKGRIHIVPVRGHDSVEARGRRRLLSAALETRLNSLKLQEFDNLIDSY